MNKKYRHWLDEASEYGYVYSIVDVRCYRQDRPIDLNQFQCSTVVMCKIKPISRCRRIPNRQEIA